MTRPKAWTKTLSVGKLSDLLGFNCKFTSVPISIPYRGFYGTGRAGAGVALKEKMQEKSQEKSEKGKLWFGPLLWQILNQTRKCFQRAWRGGNEDADWDARKQTRVQREKPGDPAELPVREIATSVSLGGKNSDPYLTSHRKTSSYGLTRLTPTDRSGKV